MITYPIMSPCRATQLMIEYTAKKKPSYTINFGTGAWPVKLPHTHITCIPPLKSLFPLWGIALGSPPRKDRRTPAWERAFQVLTSVCLAPYSATYLLRFTESHHSGQRTRDINLLAQRSPPQDRVSGFNPAVQVQYSTSTFNSDSTLGQGKIIGCLPKVPIAVTRPWPCGT